MSGINVLHGGVTMSKRYKILINLLLLTSIVVSFTACKIIEDNKDIFDTKEPIDEDMAHPGHGHPDETDAFQTGHFEPTPTNLSYIKLNNELIDVSLNMSGDLFNARKNNTVAKTTGASIQTIEFGFTPTNTVQDIKNFISVNLRSLDGEKSLNISYETYPMGNINEVTQFEEHVSVNYDDYRGRYHASSYGSPSDGASTFFEVNSQKLSIDVIQLFRFLQENQLSETDRHMHMPSQPEQGDYDIASKFFADELFSLQISMGGELIYDNQVFWALNNCVFASSEPSPSDVGDICKAYLAMY